MPRACRRGLRARFAAVARDAAPRGAGWHVGQKTLLRPPTLIRRIGAPQP